MTTTEANAKLIRLLADRDHADRQVQEERVALQAAKDRQAAALEAQGIVQAVAAGVQAAAHSQIAGLVSRCLRAVFGEQAYVFAIDFKRARGKTEATLTFRRGGLVLDKPMEEAGGGCVAVAAFALMLSRLLLARPRRRPVLCLDEPLERLKGAEYQERAGALVTLLARELGVQLIIASNEPWLQDCGKVIRLDGTETSTTES